MPVAPMEREALHAQHEGDVQSAVRMLSDSHGLDDLATLRGATESALSAFAVSLRPGVDPTPVSVDQVAEVIGLSLDGRLGEWPAPGRDAGLRAGVHAALERFISVIDAACVIRARADARTA